MTLTKQERLDARKAFLDIAKRANEAALDMMKGDIAISAASQAYFDIDELGKSLLRQLIADIVD